MSRAFFFLGEAPGTWAQRKDQVMKRPGSWEGTHFGWGSLLTSPSEPGHREVTRHRESVHLPCPPAVPAATVCGLPPASPFVCSTAESTGKNG